MIRLFSRAFLLTIAASAICAAGLSPQTSRSTPLGVGEISPDFALDDQKGHKTSLSESRGKSPVGLVFYRGYW